jgi:hypothetical protein
VSTFDPKFTTTNLTSAGDQTSHDNLRSRIHTGSLLQFSGEQHQHHNTDNNTQQELRIERFSSCEELMNVIEFDVLVEATLVSLIASFFYYPHLCFCQAKPSPQ